MSKLEEIKRKALEKLNSKTIIKEGRIQYDENCTERMNPNLEKELRERKHSLGSHPIFPESDEMHFEEKLLSKRFSDVVNNYKRQFDSETANPVEAMSNLLPLLKDTISIESKYKKELEDIAIELIKNEYDITDDDIEIHAELTNKIDLNNVQKNPSPIIIDDMNFENHDSLINANKEVYKRRFINCLTQGASKKGHNMFHLIDDKLTKLNPTLLNKYAKIMAIADYGFLINDTSSAKTAGGKVEVSFENDKPIIYAQALTFPVLIHELVKGVMEILSANGLPSDEKLTEYVLGKADYLNAEHWDMILGPSLWERFTDCIDPEHFDIKHHIYSDLISLPVDEFNSVMREIMLGSNEGKSKIREIVKDIENDLKLEDYENAINDSNEDNHLSLDDLDDIDFTNLF